MNSSTDFLTGLDQEFTLRTASYFPLLKDICSHSFFSGGKRLRPLLCYEIAKHFLKPGDQKWLSVLRFATNVECIHTFSLVHDDLPCMDDDDERRGQPTAHKKFGEAQALLAGDQLFLMGLTPVGDSCDPEILRVAIDLIGDQGLISGQLEELYLKKPGPEEILLISAKKTGALFAFCLAGTALICCPSDFALEDFISLGLKMGQGFQVADDKIDFSEGEKDPKNIYFLLGEQEASNYLNSLYSECREISAAQGLRNETFIALLHKIFFREI